MTAEELIIFANGLIKILKCKVLIFFFRKKKSAKKLKHAAIEVARASPPIFKGFIKIKLKTRLMAKEIAAILTGVAVSFIE